MAAVEEYILITERDKDMPSMMPVDDVFSITGLGTVATGRIDPGEVKVSDELDLIGLNVAAGKSSLTSVDMFRRLLDYAEAGDNIGALLRGVSRDYITR